MQRCSGVRPLASCAFGLAPYSTFRKVSVAKSKVPSIPTSRLPHPIAAAGFACDLRWQHSAVLSSTARVNCRSSTAQLSCRRGVSEERCARETTSRSGLPVFPSASAPDGSAIPRAMIFFTSSMSSSLTARISAGSARWALRLDMGRHASNVLRARASASTRIAAR